VARIGAGIAGATIATAQAYIADCTTPQNRSRGMALIGMAFGLGFTVGPLIGSLAVGGGSAQAGGALPEPGPWPGYAAALLSGVALVLAIFLLPESRWNQVRDPAADEADLDRDPDGSPTWSSAALWHAVQIPTVPALLAAIFVCVTSFASFETTISMLISGRSRLVPQFAFSDRGVFFVFAFIGLVLAVVQGGVVRRLAGKVADSTLAMSGGLIELIGFGLMMAAVQIGSIQVLLAALAVVVTGFAFVSPSLNGLLSRRTRADQQGGVLGVGQSVSSLARIVGAALGPTLLARQTLAPFTTALVLMLCGCGLIWWQGRIARS
jgi:MFS family permease